MAGLPAHGNQVPLRRSTPDSSTLDKGTGGQGGTTVLPRATRVFRSVVQVIISSLSVIKRLHVLIWRT